MANNTSMPGALGAGPSGWGIVEICNLLLALLGGTLNVTVLIAFVVRSAFFSPFTIYLISLLVANFMETAFAKLAAALWVAWPGFRSHSSCDFYLFSSYLAMAGMINTHLLISFNRLWAVTFSVSYKNHHSKKMALGICAGMWAYIFTMVLPQLIRDSLYYRLSYSVHGRCMLNNDAQPVLYFSTLMIVYIIPEFVILLTFPVIWMRSKRRRTRKVIHGTPVTALVTEDGRSMGPARSESTASQRRSMQVLIILMVSMLVCWTPLMSGTVVACFMNFKDRIYFGVGTFLFAVEAITDPILFGLVFSQISIRKIWRKLTNRTE